MNTLPTFWQFHEFVKTVEFLFLFQISLSTCDKKIDKRKQVREFLSLKFEIKIMKVLGKKIVTNFVQTQTNVVEKFMYCLLLANWHNYFN